MKLKVLLGVLIVLLTLGLVPVAAAAAEPSVSVSKTSGLTRGTSVTVTGSGITPGAEVRVIECDRDISPADYPYEPCAPLTTVTASGAGALSVAVTLVDLTHTRVFGSDAPVYCRDDGCRIILAWTEGDDPDDPAGYHSVVSQPLEFTGSTATISVSPSRNLSKTRWVTVTGTALGAEGHTIKVFEQACYDLVQGNGCYGQLPVTWGTVKADGTYRVKYQARRYLSTGDDCVNPDILGSCLVSVVVLDAQGRRDDSFGVSSIGDPGAGVSFRGISVTSYGGGSDQTWQLTGHGLPAGSTLQVVQCDYYRQGPSADGNCPVSTTVQADARGDLPYPTVVPVALLVHHEYADGDKTPVYCRDDKCRVFLVRTDGPGGGTVVGESAPLDLPGASATVDVQPSSRLTEKAWVTVTGTAVGAEGRKVQVVEQACYPRTSFEPCYGQLPVRWATVQEDGTFSVKYPAQRRLADARKTDCRNTGTEARCRISAIVLDDAGRRDDSFGVKRIGHPGKGITFASTT